MPYNLTCLGNSSRAFFVSGNRAAVKSDARGFPRQEPSETRLDSSFFDSAMKKPDHPQKRYSKYKDGHVYLLRIHDLLLAINHLGEDIRAAFPIYKIGLAHNLERRLKTLSREHHMDVIHTIPSNDIQGLEAELHTHFQDKWFKNEYFDLDASDVQEIKNWPH